MGVAKAETAYVGDSEVDVITARNTGMDCLAVSWGFRSPETLRDAGAERIFSTPRELLETIYPFAKRRRPFVRRKSLARRRNFN